MVGRLDIHRRIILNLVLSANIIDIKLLRLLVNCVEVTSTSIEVLLVLGFH